MSEYTPALSQLEFAYQETQERLCGTSPFVASAEFERAIAKVAEAAKVEALREAANSIEGGNLSEPVARKEPSTMGYNLGREDAVKLLRHRADRIEAGEGA